MEKKPKVISSKDVYQGWLKVRKDRLILPRNKIEYDYDVVCIGEGVAMLPFFDKDTLFLMTQYRHPVQEDLLELVQGGINSGESIEAAAQRELMEETGYSAETIKYMTTTYPLPGSLEMKLHIVKSYCLEKVQEPKLDCAENPIITLVPYQEVLKGVLSNKHKDSALVTAILYNEVKRLNKS